MIKIKTKLSNINKKLNILTKLEEEKSLRNKHIRIICGIIFLLILAAIITGLSILYINKNNNADIQTKQHIVKEVNTLNNYEYNNPQHGLTKLSNIASQILNLIQTQIGDAYNGISVHAQTIKFEDITELNISETINNNIQTYYLNIYNFVGNIVKDSQSGSYTDSSPIYSGTVHVTIAKQPSASLMVEEVSNWNTHEIAQIVNLIQSIGLNAPDPLKPTRSLASNPFIKDFINSVKSNLHLKLSIAGNITGLIFKPLTYSDITPPVDKTSGSYNFSLENLIIVVTSSDKKVKYVSVGTQKVIASVDDNAKQTILSGKLNVTQDNVSEANTFIEDYIIKTTDGTRLNFLSLYTKDEYLELNKLQKSLVDVITASAGAFSFTSQTPSQITCKSISFSPPLQKNTYFDVNFLINGLVIKYDNNKQYKAFTNDNIYLKFNNIHLDPNTMNFTNSTNNTFMSSVVNLIANKSLVWKIA